MATCRLLFNEVVVEAEVLDRGITYWYALAFVAWLLLRETPPLELYPLEFIVEKYEDAARDEPMLPVVAPLTERPFILL